MTALGHTGLDAPLMAQTFAMGPWPKVAVQQADRRHVQLQYMWADAVRGHFSRRTVQLHRVCLSRSFCTIDGQSGLTHIASDHAEPVAGQSKLFAAQERARASASGAVGREARSAGGGHF